MVGGEHDQQPDEELPYTQLLYQGEQQAKFLRQKNRKRCSTPDFMYYPVHRRFGEGGGVGGKEREEGAGRREKEREGGMAMTTTGEGAGGRDKDVAKWVQGPNIDLVTVSLSATIVADSDIFFCRYQRHGSVVAGI